MKIYREEIYFWKGVYLIDGNIYSEDTKANNIDICVDNDLYVWCLSLGGIRALWNFTGSRFISEKEYIINR